MASPHVSGVAALVVSQYGSQDGDTGGLTVGADGLADDIQSGADNIQDYASENLSEAGSELSQAGEDVWGG